MSGERSVYPPWNAEVVEDSVYRGERLTTMALCVPNAIHQEMLRHRAFSFSVESQRAVPAKEFRERIEADGPYVPPMLARSGSMQARLGLPDKPNRDFMVTQWAVAWRNAVDAHIGMEPYVHKSIANRLLAPFAWTRMVVTGTAPAWRHFFRLRCHENADVAIQAVASRAFAAYLCSEPVERTHHLPFVDREKVAWVDDAKRSAAACASISYGGVRRKERVEAMAMADRLWAEGHASPFEHQAAVASRTVGVWPGNLGGSHWRQFRVELEQRSGKTWPEPIDGMASEMESIAAKYGDADAILPDGTRLRIVGSTLEAWE